VLSPFRHFLLGNREQSQWHYKERQDQESEQEVIHKSLIVEDHVGGKSELIMPGSVAVYPFCIRMIITKFGAYGYKLVGPPSDADGMLGIVRGEAGPTADLVVKIFVSHGEKGTGRNPEHRVIQHRPFRRISISHRKGAALKRDLIGRMINRVFHVHVPSFRPWYKSCR
jgi:hypothetical protein